MSNLYLYAHRFVSYARLRTNMAVQLFMLQYKQLLTSLGHCAVQKMAFLTPR